MNKITKTIILSVTALATLAGTIEMASAGDRFWRKHHGRNWHNRAVIGGIAAGVVIGGAIIASRPRVVYRDAPVVVEEGPVYDNSDTVYAEPEDEYGRRVYRDVAPDDDDYATSDEDYDNAPRTSQRRYADQGDQGDNDGYFPDKPQKNSQRRDDNSRKYAQNAGALKPWTSQWRSYCADRYASFNPSNGTYLGYDQKRHFCKAG